MRINPNIQETLDAQYLQPGEDAEMMFRRVANFVAGAEKGYGHTDQFVKVLADKYYEAMSQGLFMPSSPFLMNAGTKAPMLAACFVVDINDDIRSIFESLTNAAIIHKQGGGTGFDFSPLRHRGAPILSTGGTSTGVLSFLSLFNLEGDVIKQGGKRRSANIVTLRVDHPEILDFIDAKLDTTKFTNFNFSVQIPDWFMNKVRANENYDLLDHNCQIVDTLSAVEVFDRIISNNWTCSEPGVLFIDHINKNNAVPHLGKIMSTNPCGELPLLPGEACNLASINLDWLYSEDEHDVDWLNLRELVEMGIRFLDSSIDVNQYPTELIERSVKKTRKLGLGIMGLHGLLIKLGLKYDSPEARAKAKGIMRFMFDVAEETSFHLGNQRGVPECFTELEKTKVTRPRRNATLLSIAPTGTIALIADSSSSGCEPIFALIYDRRTRDRRYVWENSLFKSIGVVEGWYTQELVEKIIQNSGSAKGIIEVPKRWQNLFITAQEIEPEAHVLMQAALQESVDNSISKTVNMPASSTIGDIRKVYELAWSQGCKGITIYRDGTRDGVMKVGPGVEKKREVTGRPKYLSGDTTKVTSGCGALWVTINQFEGRVWEVFCKSGAKGGCSANIEEIARLISLALRKGIPIEEVIDQLESVRCSTALLNPECSVRSCAHGIAVEIKSFLDRHSSDSVVISEGAFVGDLLKTMGCKSGNCG